VMKPLAVLLAAAGVGSAAAATTMITIAGPNAAQNITIGDWNDQRPGPDSSRVARLLTTMGSTDPVACEMLSDQIGNFWWGSDEWGIGRLSDARTDVRAAKDSVSGQVRDPGAIRHLIATLSADDPCVRRTAAKMLGNSTIGDNELARLFDDASPRVREAALYAVGHEERPGLRTQVEGLLGRDENTAAMAAWALGNLEMRESVGPLTNALERGSQRVKINAAWALGMIEDGRAVDALRRVLRDADPILRATAVSALGDIEAMSSAADVERVLREDSDRRVRLEAINALGNIESITSLEVLSSVLEGNDVELSIAAIEAIDNLDEIGRAPAGLLRAISSNVPELRKVAAMALGNIADPNTVDALIGLLRDPDAEVRYAAVEGLGEIGTPAAKPGLTRALEDSSAEVRRAAVEALAEIEDNENG
jgi:HEAT repeat protein